MLDLETILILVSEALNLPIHQIKQCASKRPELCDARSLVVFFCDKEQHHADDIAKKLGYKSGKNIPYHLDRVYKLIKTDRMLQKAYAKCSLKIKSYRAALVVAEFVR